MVTNLSILSLNIVRKMADAAEIEARKLGADVAIAVVASDSSVYFTRNMDKVDGMLAREIMKRAMNALEKHAADDVVFIDNAAGNLGAIAIDGADMLTNKRCIEAALSIIEA
jgi:uncharacterized protein GlcG (DUF336 family)